MSSSPSPRKRKPGPKPMRPTKRQRHQVEVGVSIGLTVDQIATAVAIPRHTIYRHFSDELARAAAPETGAPAGDLMECVTESCKINCSPKVKKQFQPKWCVYSVSHNKV